jgi:hypothetical protein
MIGIGLDSLGAHGIAVDVQMRVINGVVFVSTRGYGSEGSGVEKLAAPEGGFPDVTSASTVVQAPAADARLGGDVARPVIGLKRLVRIGAVQIHYASSVMVLGLILPEKIPPFGAANIFALAAQGQS